MHSVRYTKYDFYCHLIFAFTQCYFFNTINVFLYQVKLLIFYNVQTTLNITWYLMSLW